jgi:hypothetical protein
MKAAMSASDKNQTDHPGDAPPQDPLPRDVWPRILWIAVIVVMISVAQSLLLVVALLQVVIMLTSKGRPNEELADFGAMVGAWVAKAARYQSAASDEKPWPWRPMGN